MFTVYIHKIILPKCATDTFASFQLIFGAQKYKSRIILPLTPDITEYNLYNERFVFEDPNTSPFGMNLSKEQQQAESHSVILLVTCHVDY